MKEVRAVAETITLTAGDGVALEGEHQAPVDGSPVRAGAVLCHPHPQYGGTMRSIVISALFEALPRAGVDCLRFNFRGVENSAGHHDDGDAERLDVHAAIDAESGRLLAGVPLLVAGWSFGADIALSCTDPAIAGWLLIAPPLRFGRDLEPVTDDPRPKLVVLAQHDEFRDPDEVAREVASWRNAQSLVIAGASHFFVGRTDQVSAHAISFVAALSG